jgi:hypothetical protein
MKAWRGAMAACALLLGCGTSGAAAGGGDAEGVDALADGLDASGDGLDASGDGSDALADGLDASADGSDALADGLDASGDGLDASADGSDASGDGSDALADGFDASGDGSDALADGFDASGDGSDAGGKDIGPGQCSTEQACKSGLCYQPGQSIGCGMCKPGESTCQDDSKCALEDICRPVVCSCEGALACQPGCKTASDCAEGQTCAGDFHCTSLVCKPGDASCPADFACVMPTSGNPGCMRKTCSASSECQGVCVKGECFSQPGTCNFPPP